MNAIFKRKSIMKFKNQLVEDEKIINLLKAGMQAPSAHNSQPWEFIVVSNPLAIEEVSKMSPYAAPAKGANKLIITLTNMNRIYDKKTDDWFVQDMSACCENILLQAVDEGLGAVWLGFYPSLERVYRLKEYFKVPENIMPFSVIAIGYYDNKTPVKKRFDKSKIHIEKY